MANAKPKVEVRHVGTREVCTGRRYRLADAWAVYVNGKELQPWMSEREARRLAKQIAEEGLVRPRETTDKQES